MKKNVPLLTWKEIDHNVFVCNEYEFRVSLGNEHQVKFYYIWDNGKRLEEKFYAAINARDYAKRLYKKKLKKGEVIKVTKKVEVKDVWPSLIINEQEFENENLISVPTAAPVDEASQDRQPQVIAPSPAAPTLENTIPVATFGTAQLNVSSENIREPLNAIINGDSYEDEREENPW